MELFIVYDTHSIKHENNSPGLSLIMFGYLSMTGMVRASGVLHTRMLQCVLRSPMAFFDTTPVGRIINRYDILHIVMDCLKAYIYV